MKEIIKDKLAEIEKTEKVKILYCVESGSRAWGFASPDSDYDVRFIYVREKDFYLKLEDTRDVIEWQLDDTLDINGWDIQKALRLLRNSNPTLFEWKASPIVYKTTKEWEELAPLFDDCFMIKPMFYHYLSMAKKTYKDKLMGDLVQLKKYFYALRPLFACKWLLEKQTPPPMHFQTLFDEYLDEKFKPVVAELIEIKVNSLETAKGKPIESLMKYLNDNILQMETELNKLPTIPKADWEKLNEYFLKLLH